MDSKRTLLLVLFIAIIFISGCVNSKDTSSKNNSSTQTSLHESGNTTINLSTCTTDWNCSSWSECLPTGIQVRTCTDKNNCSTYSERWVDSNTCTFTPANITAVTLIIQDIGNVINYYAEKNCTSSSDPKPNLPSCTPQNIQVRVPGTKHFISSPSIKIINSGTSDLNDVSIDVSILNKEGVVLHKMVNVRYLQGRDVIKTVYAGDDVVGKLDYFVDMGEGGIGTYPSGRYALKIDLRKGASTKIIATDSKGFDI